MKTFTLQFFLTLIIAGIAQLFLPWWSLAIAAGLVAVFFSPRYLYTSYLAGFLSLFLLWAAYSGWIYLQPNGALLPDKVGELFGGLTGPILIGVSGLIAGIMGGFGALSGTLGRRLFRA